MSIPLWYAIRSEALNYCIYALLILKIVIFPDESREFLKLGSRTSDVSLAEVQDNNTHSMKRLESSFVRQAVFRLLVQYLC